MTVNETFNNRTIVSNIPLVFEGRELSSKLQAKLMIMRVTYDKSVSAFQEKMQEVVKGLKVEGYDNLEAEIKKMLAIEKKEDASKEELEEAKRIREEKYADYEEKKKVLIEKVNEAYNQEGLEQTDIKVKKFTEEEYSEIISVIKTEGKIKYAMNNDESVDIPKMAFLSMIAANLVE